MAGAGGQVVGSSGAHQSMDPAVSLCIPQHTATDLQHTATDCNTLQHTARRWQHDAKRCNTLTTVSYCDSLYTTNIAAHYNKLLYTAKRWQRNATRCNTLTTVLILL